MNDGARRQRLTTVRERRKAHYRLLSEEEFRVEFDRKLSERIAVCEASREIEELADIEEIIRALVRAKGCTLREFEKLRKQKAAQNGAFAKRIFLETADD